jgi:hypothetical protein
LLQSRGGNVGIGTATPPSIYETLTIANANAGGYNSIRIYSINTISSGSIFHIGFYNASVNVGSIVTNGATGVTAYNTTSDARLKKNINYEFDGLTIINQLKPACYHMMSDTTNIVYHGFIAQDILPIYPQYVSVPSEGIEDGYYSMDYSQFMGIAVKAIQQQSIQITTLQSTVTSQAAEISTLQTQLTAVLTRLAAAGIA